MVSSKSFVRRAHTSYYAYLSKFEGWKGHYMLSDGGPIFGVNGEDIFDSLVIDGRATFTPPSVDLYPPMPASCILVQWLLGTRSVMVTAMSGGVVWCWCMSCISPQMPNR